MEGILQCHQPVVPLYSAEISAILHFQGSFFGKFFPADACTEVKQYRLFFYSVLDAVFMVATAISPPLQVFPMDLFLFAFSVVSTAYVSSQSCASATMACQNDINSTQLV